MAMVFPSTQLVLFIMFLCTSTYPTQSAALTPTHAYCNNNTKIDTTGLVSINIDIVLARLVATVTNDGFSTASMFGVYGLAQCRRDVSRTDCFLCIQEAAKQIRQRCPDQADSRIWYDTCFLRYNTKDFFGQVDTSFGIYVFNVKNVTNPVAFGQRLGGLTEEIGSEALVPKNKGFGSGKTNVSSSDSIYGLVQCTRDLSPFSCSQCLAKAFSDFKGVCNGKRGCRVLYSSCYADYEMYPFFNSLV